MGVRYFKIDGVDSVLLELCFVRRPIRSFTICGVIQDDQVQARMDGEI